MLTTKSLNNIMLCIFTWPTYKDNLKFKFKFELFVSNFSIKANTGNRIREIWYWARPVKQSLIKFWVGVTNVFILTFTGQCIVIYSYYKSQKDAPFLNFILVNNSSCFGQTYRPSSGVLILYSQQQVYVTDI